MRWTGQPTRYSKKWEAVSPQHLCLWPQYNFSAQLKTKHGAPADYSSLHLRIASTKISLSLHLKQLSPHPNKDMCRHDIVAALHSMLKQQDVEDLNI